MNPFTPIRLQDDYVVLEPMSLDHAPALEAAAADGELWNLMVTSVPPPGHARRYIESALQGQAAGAMLPFAVREAGSGQIVGSTRYYEIDADVPRLAIGYTWYARRWQKTHINTACKRLLLEHAFETLQCVAVAFHTDEKNEDSQRAIERLGAQREGVLRAQRRRNDGSLRNTVCFSILAEEWPNVANWLDMRLNRLAANS
ncbi:GNAT family N-acetyltransferase [Bacillus sp. SRB_336]|jgi:N-acetyltransferase|nr:GNAT family N-acetyltransferase [Bacillus sp. SRB_336]